MGKLSREDMRALLDSEVYQELEAAAIRKQAQSTGNVDLSKDPKIQSAVSTLANKIQNIPVSAADDKDAHAEIRAHMKKLNDHDVFELYKMFDDEVEARGLDNLDFEKEFEDEEMNEDESDEKKEEDDMEEIFAYVKSTLTKIANNAADNNDTEGAYIVERAIQRLKY